nr:phospholipase-like, aminotransferase-like mobile domain protein [Tanacetum cinerariifolium]
MPPSMPPATTNHHVVVGGYGYGLIGEYPAKIHVRSKLHYFPLIKDRLNEARHPLFRTTCFRPWLDISYVENDDGMIHYVLQNQSFYDDESFNLPLIYHLNGHSLHFGLRQFCLVTGFKFGLISLREHRNGDIPFRNRLFPEKIGYDVKIIDVLAFIEDEEKFSKVNDEDAIRLCLLLFLEVIFMGRELVFILDDAFLRMVNYFDAWNSSPWGEQIWRQLYDSIRNVCSKHKLEHLDGLRKNHNHVRSYTLSGFLFAFKTLIELSPTKAERQSSWYNESNDFFMWYAPRSPPVSIGGILAKVEFPKFQEDDVRGWVFRCDQFFSIDNTSNEEKVKIVSVHLTDKALLWHRSSLIPESGNQRVLIRMCGSMSGIRS